MITFDLTFFALAIPAVIFAGISKGGFGSGAAFAAGSILVIAYPPAVTLGLLLPLLMLIDVANLRPYWRKWSWEDCKLVILGGVPGVALGAWLLAVAPADVIRFLIGLVSLLFVAWQLSKERGWVRDPQRRLGRGVGLTTGVAAGFTSFVSHAGGPPVAVYLLSQKLDKLAYQASTVLIFWAINLMKFGPYAALGAFTRDTWIGFALLAPFALLGSWAGVRLHHMIPAWLFFRITYVLLTVTGTKLIWDALT